MIAWKPERVLLAVIDAVLFAVAWVLAYNLRFLETGIPQSPTVASDNYLEQMKLLLPWIVLTHVGFYYLFNVYRGILRYAGFVELKAIAIATVCQGLLWILLNAFLYSRIEFLQLPQRSVGTVLEVIPIPWSILVLYLGLSAAMTGGLRFMRRLFAEASAKSDAGEAHRTLIVGAGDLADSVLRTLVRQGSTDYRPVCAVAVIANRVGMRLHGVPVVGTVDKLPEILREERKEKIERVLIALDSQTPAELRRVVTACENAEVSFAIVPSLSDIARGSVETGRIREIQIEDLLGREPVRIQLPEERNYLRGETVLITGAGGSIGSELSRQVAASGPARLILLGKGENSIFDISAQVGLRFKDVEVLPLVGDVRDPERMEALFRMHRPSVVFHAAAHKHVPLMEHSPDEAVKNNILGTANVAFLSERYGVSRFVLISSDKAVRPTSVMGATKRYSEMIVFALAETSQCTFQAVRFGNVLGSRGSVIPTFREQIRAGGPVTVTHPDVTRYFMTIPEAVSLVLQAGSRNANGSLYLLDMGEPVRIVDLARNMIALSGLRPDQDIKIDYIGMRPGEKLHEELLTQYEGAQKTEIEKLFATDHPRSRSLEQVRGDLAALSEMAQQSDGEKIIYHLTRIIPDYHPANRPDLEEVLLREQILAVQNHREEKAPAAALESAPPPPPEPEEPEEEEPAREASQPDLLEDATPEPHTDIPFPFEEPLTSEEDFSSSELITEDVDALEPEPEPEEDIALPVSDEPLVSKEEPLEESMELVGQNTEPTPIEAPQEDESLFERVFPEPPPEDQVLENQSLIAVAAEEKKHEEIGDVSLAFPIQNEDDVPTVAMSDLEQEPELFQAMTEESVPVEQEAGMPALPAEEEFSAAAPQTIPTEEEFSRMMSETTVSTSCVLLLRVSPGFDPETAELMLRQVQDNVLGSNDKIVCVGDAATLAALPDTLSKVVKAEQAEGAVVLEVLEQVPKADILITMNTEVLFAGSGLENFRQALAGEKAVLAYSNYKEDKDGEVSTVELHDHNGCPHERFEYGPVIAYKASALRQVGGVRKDLNFAWEYDMHLKLMEIGEFVRIHDFTYTRFIPVIKDHKGSKVFSPGMGPLGGFSYVFYPADVEKEVTSVFEEALKRRGAWIDHEFATVNHEGRSYETLASIVIPILNRVKYIANAIEKVQQGTFPDFEMVIIDNGSTDGTIELVKEIAAKDNRIRLIHGKGGSIASALNEGIKAARGKYICQLDSDDEYAPDCLEKMIGHLESNPKCGLAISYYRLMDEDGNIIEGIEPITHNGYTRNQIIRRDGAGAVRIFPKAVLEEFGYYDEEHYGNFGEDYDMVLKTGEKYSVDRVHKVLYHYRRHADNTDVTRDPAMKYNNKNRARQQALARRKAINKALGKI